MFIGMHRRIARELSRQNVKVYRLGSKFPQAKTVFVRLENNTQAGELCKYLARGKSGVTFIDMSLGEAHIARRNAGNLYPNFYIDAAYRNGKSFVGGCPDPDVLNLIQSYSEVVRCGKLGEGVKSAALYGSGEIYTKCTPPLPHPEA